MLAQHSVHPVPDRPGPTAWLDVDVAGPLRDAVSHDQVGQLHNRRRLHIVLGDVLGAHLLDQLHGGVRLVHLGLERAEQRLDRLLRGGSAGRVRPRSPWATPPRRPACARWRSPARAPPPRPWGHTSPPSGGGRSPGTGKIWCFLAIASGMSSAALGSARLRSATSRRKYSATSSARRWLEMENARVRAGQASRAGVAGGDVQRLPSKAGPFGDPDQPVYGARPARWVFRRGGVALARGLGGSTHRRTILRLPRFCSYMAASAWVRRSSRRTRSSPSCCAMPMLTASWYGSRCA